MSDRDDPGQPEGEPSGSRPSPAFAFLGLVAALIAVAIAIWSTRRSEQGEVPNANMPDSGAPPSEQAPRAASAATTDAQLAAAFQAAFGKAGQAELTSGDDTRTYRPSRLLRVDDQYVLLSEGRNASDCHVCSGGVAIHYLHAQGDGFTLAGSWPDLVPGMGFGEPPDWSISDAYSSYPTLVAETGYTAQGCTSGGVWLTELRPGKPVRTELVPTHFENASGMGELDGQSIEGKIVNIRKDASFEVIYSGARSFTEKWVKKGNVYRLESGETKMPQC